MDAIVSFATLEDLAARTGATYEGDDATRATTLLEDASCALVVLGLDPDEDDPYRLRLAKLAVCNAVGHKLARDSQWVDATQLTQTVGPYSQSVALATPSGSLSFLRQDLSALGLAGSRYRGIQAASADLGEAAPW